MHNRSTMKQVARALDLSIATVSKALGDYGDISEKTRTRVRQKAREMGYVPNNAGRTLVSGRSGFIGLVIPVRGPQLVDAFLGEFVTGLAERLTHHHCDLFLATALESQRELEVLKHVVESGRADGIVLNRIWEEDERVDYLLSRRFPFVTHGRIWRDDPQLNWLDSNGASAFKQAFELLYGLGHRRFGLLSITDRMSFSRYREEGLLAAIEDKADPHVVLSKVTAPRFDLEKRHNACRELLTSEPRPTAVLCLFDELALTLMEEATRLRINIPRDLSIIGFDNIPAAAYVSPGLTTFGQDIRESAFGLADMLMRLISEPRTTGLQRQVQPQLLSRASHGPAPAA